MILVFIEHKDCVLNKTSLEAITAAQTLGRELGLSVAAVIPCANECPLASDIASYDIAKVIVAKNEKLGTYTPDGYTDAFAEIIRANNPKYVLMAHTYQVRDFAPKLATRFGKEVLGDCIRYKNEGGKLTFTRRIFLGKLDADVTVGGDAPYFVTFQSGAFRGDNAAKGNLISANGTGIFWQDSSNGTISGNPTIKGSSAAYHQIGPVPLARLPSCQSEGQS